MSQLLEVTLKQINKKPDTQSILINASRASVTEAVSSDTEILYAKGVGVGMDTLLVDETYATIQTAIGNYNSGVNIQVPVVVTNGNVRSYTLSLEVDNIVYVYQDTAISTRSVIFYVEANKVLYKQYTVDLDFDEILALTENSVITLDLADAAIFNAATKVLTIPLTVQYGQIFLLTGATDSITDIVNFPSTHKCRFYADDGDVVTITYTAVAGAAAGQLIGKGASTVLTGANMDWVDLLLNKAAFAPATPGVIAQQDCCVYT